MAQSAEHVLGKDEVTSSNLVSSSKYKRPVLGLVFYIWSIRCGGESARFTRLTCGRNPRFPTHAPSLAGVLRFTLDISLWVYEDDSSNPPLSAQ